MNVRKNSCASCLTPLAVGVLLILIPLPRVAADDPAAAQAAMEQANQQETKSYEEWDSHEMARSATREIARSERKRTEETLAAYRVACEALTAAAAGKNAETIAAAEKSVQERLEVLRQAVKQMVADSTAGDKAAQEELAAEGRHKAVMCAARDAQLQVLRIKAAAQQPDSPEAKAAQRAVHDCEALKLYELRQWTRIHRNTGAEMAEMNHHAGRIATGVAAVEADPARKTELEAFAAQQAKLKSEADALIAREDAAYDAAAPQLYALRAAAMGGLKPLAPEAFDYAKARHLLVRVGYGGTPQEVEKLRAMGLHKAVDHLVEYHRQPAGTAAFEAVPPAEVDPYEGKLKNRFMSGQVAGARLAEENQQMPRLREWWLKRAVESQRPLQEKLTLFWHGHFANQNSVVGNSYLMYRQNQLFREHAAGNFASLLYGIVHDPAMIRYLDNNRNVKGDPNENLAREIMELFAMGRDQGYTEKDIIQAARALTGYTYDHQTAGFRFDFAKHDTGEKVLFGKAGTWSGDDVVRLILEQPATSKFIAKKLFEFFACMEPDQAAVEGLASVLTARNYELTPMLRNLFLSEAFYSPSVVGAQIKSPVQLVVGTLRDMGVTHLNGYGAVDSAIQQMGQQLFEPPDVKGWRYGRTWISSNRLFVRYNSISDLIRSAPGASTNGVPGVDLVALLEAGGSPIGAAAVDYLAKACLMRPLPEAKRAELAAFLGELPPAAEWAKQRAAVNARLQNLMVLMLSTPEYQLM
ncbi:MAG: DUF1800 family protein [Verrucomicrobiales bacterium]|nr:DUF1800 family protein [Verrucomicrobiales bacterium]